MLINTEKMLRTFKPLRKLFHRTYCSSGAIQQVKPSIEKPEKKLNFSQLNHATKVPLSPVVSDYPESTQKIEIDSKTIQLLERLSLVDLDSKEALKTLEASIQFADKISHIDTGRVEPLYTVLENRPLELRSDEITDGNIKEDVLSNAKVVEEDYFVAPPGNIPLEQEEKKFD